MPKVKSSCDECQHEIEFWPSQARRFCSQSCRSAWFARTRMPTKPRRGVTLPCEACGKGVYRSEGEVTKRFCSVRCKNEHMARNQIVSTCQVCGSEFRRSPSVANYTKLLYCSKPCEGRGRMRRALDREHNGRPALLDIKGYVRIFEPDHPNAMNGGWMFEHRWVMEQQLGRHLTQSEHVHHVNGVKDDNRPENLEVLGHAEHSRLTQRERKAELLALRSELAEYRRRYGPLT